MAGFLAPPGAAAGFAPSLTTASSTACLTALFIAALDALALSAAMIFIRKDGTVAGVVENAEPKTLDGRSVGKESRHVLEVNGGFARLHGIGEGTRVSYEHVDLTGFDK